MAASPEQARINGRKGGRPRGLNAINAEKGKALLLKMYLDNIRPINEALINKAREGDMQAIKEIHDRVYGRAPQPLTGSNGGNIVFEIVKYAKDTDTTQI
jgi:hypothetical protein